MGHGFKHGAGGGAGLNFKVVGGRTQPANPAENTIWVNTAKTLTSYVFSPVEPEVSDDGMVWITTGTSSEVSFNALKKNGIVICPLYAKQYVDGAWVDVTAKCYQDGEWAEMLTEVVFYENGKFNTTEFGAINGTYTNNDGIVMARYNELTHETAFDVSAFSTVEIVVSTYNWGNMTLTILTESGATATSLSFASAGTHTLDISALTGNHYLKLYCQANASSDYTTMSSIKFLV